MTETVYVASLAIRDGSNNPVTVWVGTRGWATAPTDTPADTLIEERLTQPGNFGRNMFSGGLFGPIGVDFGEAVLANPDGYLDYLSGYAVDGGTYTLRVGTFEQDPGAMTTVFVATVEALEYNLSEVVIRLRDRLWELETPVCTEVYAGTGNEEGDADIIGAPKPVVIGGVRVVRPVLVDSSNLVYQVGEPVNGGIVYVSYVADGGVELAYDSVYGRLAASLDDLFSTTPTAGEWRVYQPLGLVRLGSNPAREIAANAMTADAETPMGYTGALRLPGSLISTLAQRAGIASADIDSADVTALDAAHGSYGFGWVARDDDTTLDAVGVIASSAGAWCGFDRLGVLRMGLFEAPSGTAAETLLIHDCIAIDRIVSSDPGRGVPAYRVTVQYDSPTDPLSSVATSVTPGMERYFRNPYYVTSAEDGDILTRHPYAKDLTFDCGALKASGVNEALRRLGILKEDREIVRVTVEATPTRLGALDLDALITLKVPRYDWTSGKLFRVVGITTDLSANRLTLDLWG